MSILAKPVQIRLCVHRAWRGICKAVLVPAWAIVRLGIMEIVRYSSVERVVQNIQVIVWSVRSWCVVDVC